LCAFQVGRVPATRIILDTTFAGERDLAKNVSHETMGAMFD
jgi:hypothetical protein